MLWSAFELNALLLPSIDSGLGGFALRSREHLAHSGLLGLYSLSWADRALQPLPLRTLTPFHPFSKKQAKHSWSTFQLILNLFDILFFEPQESSSRDSLWSSTYLLNRFLPLPFHFAHSFNKNFPSLLWFRTSALVFPYVFGSEVSLRLCRSQLISIIYWKIPTLHRFILQSSTLHHLYIFTCQWVRFAFISGSAFVSFVFDYSTILERFSFSLMC